MADFEIDVGFDASELKSATSSVGGGGGTGGADNIAGGFTKGLKALGIVGLLSSLKIIMETISFALAIVSTGIAFLVTQFVQFITPFFKDPVGALLDLVVFVVNGVISGLEFLANALTPDLLQPSGGFDFGRLKVNEIENDVGEFQKTVSFVFRDGKTLFEDVGSEFVDWALNSVLQLDVAKEAGNKFFDAANQFFDDFAEKFRIEGKALASFNIGSAVSGSQTFATKGGKNLRPGGSSSVDTELQADFLRNGYNIKKRFLKG